MNKGNTTYQGMEGRAVRLMDPEMLRREALNRNYLVELNSNNLLLNFRLEAGRPTENYGAVPKNIHGGWEFPTCQLRGHFLGHWLSAAAMHYAETGDRELIGKAEMIISELAACQKDNGGEWVASIPEKYFTWIAKGKSVWAPHYTVHKLFMGLIDMYELAGNEEAMQIADRFADWFDRYSGSFDREQMDNILDFETGGMLEIWVRLYELTGKEKYERLMERYYRGRLFDVLLEGKDPLTNMHANTTIPEIIGCAKAYEVTGEEKWRKIVEAYWNCAVTMRGTYVTGGQTLGEIWTPMGQMGARLGDRNQEHCTVYNMVRLADFLFRWTGDAVYGDYIEKNVVNGLMAQAYWQSNAAHGIDDGLPKEGLLTYFLPMRTGGRKGWATKTEDFFCCHGTVIQANAAWNRYIWYAQDKTICLNQFVDSALQTEVDGQNVQLTLKEDTLTGSFHLSSNSPERQSISAVTAEVRHNPDCRMEYLMVECEKPAEFTLKIRIPSWITEAVEITVNGALVETCAAGNTYAEITRTWENGDTVAFCLKRGVAAVALPGDEKRVAFTYGPVALGGLTDEDRQIRTNGRNAAELLEHDCEREWGSWKSGFRLVGQEKGIRFVPLYEIGYEKYTVYFELDK